MHTAAETRRLVRLNQQLARSELKLARLRKRERAHDAHRKFRLGGLAEVLGWTELGADELERLVASTRRGGTRPGSARTLPGRGHDLVRASRADRRARTVAAAGVRRDAESRACPRPSTHHDRRAVRARWARCTRFPDPAGRDARVRPGQHHDSPESVERGVTEGRADVVGGNASSLPSPIGDPVRSGPCGASVAAAPVANGSVRSRRLRALAADRTGPTPCPRDRRPR